jgi:energy-coupling factor transport system ATP-binding protein
MPRRAPGEVLLRKADVRDIEVRAAEALAITGPNGAGKTTLALQLGGLRKPVGGPVSATPALAGAEAAKPPHKWRARALAGLIGSVFQNPAHQFVTAKVRDELALGTADSARVDELLVRLRLDALAEANPHTLSGGEQRRLSVATALAAAPRLLILDEPTFGQDRRTWTELVALLAGLRDDGHGVVAVTHDPDFTTALGARELPLAARPLEAVLP